MHFNVSFVDKVYQIAKTRSKQDPCYSTIFIHSSRNILGLTPFSVGIYLRVLLACH